jgi:hypothetical protein
MVMQSEYCEEPDVGKLQVRFCEGLKSISHIFSIKENKQNINRR